MNRIFKHSILLAVFTSLTLGPALVFARKPSVQLEVLGSYRAPAPSATASEIVAHDPVTQRLYVVNGATSKIDVLDISEPSTPTLDFSIDVAPYGRQANSVDVHNGVVAAAVEANIKTNQGKVVFFDTDGNFLNAVPAGALPDMITFTPNGEKVLVANEGEPNSYNQTSGPNFPSVDPEGSVTIVDLSNGVANATASTADFGGFEIGEIDPRIRVYGPGASLQQDLEPEYIAADHNSKTAYVTLQENNAIGILDIKSGEFTDLIALGFKDYSLGNNQLDASDDDAPGASNDGLFNVRNWPVFGMYEPDGIDTVKYKRQTFLVTANEGDARAWPGFNEEARVNALTLDDGVFGDVTNNFPDGLLHSDNLGRLNVTRSLGNTDVDADYEALYTLGGRSFSIWTSDGEQIYDSGDDFERKTNTANSSFFNASNDDNAFDSRSDNKGPEPEGVTVGKAYGRSYAFITLERVGGIMVYEVTNPYKPQFVQYINNRNFLAAVASPLSLDLGPEGIHFISEEDSPTGVPLVVVANEVSGTTTVYQFVQTD